MDERESSPLVTLDALRPVNPPRNLTREVVDRLQAEITGGNLKPGTRLPTEQAMMSAMGVSRTVIREAVAALRAEGLVVTRQGVGAFVANDVLQRPFRIDPETMGSLGEIVHVMELRTGVEVEAAGLAAGRATSAEKRKIEQALKAMSRSIRRGELAVDQDFAFHFAIAEATHNPQFIRFLEFLGSFIIPRQSIRTALSEPAGQRAYLENIQGEHDSIFAAIRDGDANAARIAMHTHLMRSRERYSRLAAEFAKR